MISVVMGVEDRGECQLFALQVIDHRLRFTRIDNNGMRAVADGPDVIVGEGAQRHDFIGSHLLLRYR